MPERFSVRLTVRFGSNGTILKIIIFCLIMASRTYILYFLSVCLYSFLPVYDLTASVLPFSLYLFFFALQSLLADFFLLEFRNYPRHLTAARNYMFKCFVFESKSNAFQLVSHKKINIVIHPALPDQYEKAGFVWVWKIIFFTISRFLK